MAETQTVISTLDLYEHYLSGPLSPARHLDATPTFVVNGYIHDGFVELVERLGWEVLEDNELAEETHGGWGEITIRRRRVEPPLTWTRRTENLAGHDYVSDDGRWRILSPKLSSRNRYELYDVAQGLWYGDWLTLTKAKRKAQVYSETPMSI
jgi:hypothetical protein